jgi:primase-polymerase (primpol)-like protein
VPVDPSTGEFASTTDSETWAPFESARRYAESNKLGLGFVFTETDSFVGIDLYACRVPATGSVSEWALDIVERLDSYTEISPSGTGYHIIVEGDLPEGGSRRGDVETYAYSRYFTVTGEHVEDTPWAIQSREDSLVAVHREFIRDESADKSVDIGSASESSVTLSDGAVLKHARAARNGSKFDRLYRGSTGGYDSNSEADMALCAMLSFWTGGDERQVDRLFRKSGLCRDKWDTIHFADGSTYGEKTVARAVAGTDDFYQPTRERSARAEEPQNISKAQHRTQRSTVGGMLRSGAPLSKA